MHHTTGKIVLVGDHSVGKSALGYRLIHGQFEEQASTHGQQFWVVPALGKRGRRHRVRGDFLGLRGPARLSARPRALRG